MCNLWLTSLALLLVNVPETTSSINCFRCFASIDSIESQQSQPPFELVVSVLDSSLNVTSSGFEQTARNESGGQVLFEVSYVDEPRSGEVCAWSLDLLDGSFSSYFNESNSISHIVNHIANALVNYLRIHCSTDNQSWTDTIKFSCLDRFILYRLCEIQKDLETSYLQNVLGSRVKRESRPKRCSLNNLLSTNRKIYEFGLENESLASHSQTILSTIYLVTDVITEFYNRKLAHSRKSSFYRSEPGRDGEDTVVQKISSSIEIILLQTIKYHILHKLGLRERPNVTRVAKNEYVFEALDRVYGNKINIGNTYAEKHYYSKYLQANLSKDFSNSFVDTFFEATDIGTGVGSGLEKQNNFFPKKMKYKQPPHSSDSEKQNLFGGTKILSFAEKGSVSQISYLLTPFASLQASLRLIFPMGGCHCVCE